jgi:hypothetical protein
MVENLIVFALVAAAIVFVTWKYLTSRIKLAALDALICAMPSGRLNAGLGRWRSRLAAGAACPGCNNCGACAEPASAAAGPIAGHGDVRVITIQRAPRAD